MNAKLRAYFFYVKKYCFRLFVRFLCAALNAFSSSMLTQFRFSWTPIQLKRWWYRVWVNGCSKTVSIEFHNEDADGTRLTFKAKWLFKGTFIEYTISTSL